MAEELYPTLGPVVCDWIEDLLVHGPGDIQGSPIELDDEFRRFIWRAYEVFPANHPRAGRRRYRRAFLSRPKGRAKSELAGMLCCAEALGPVRFDGWDANGDPVGRPITSAYVRCFATEENQAGNTFDNALFMLEHGAVADEYPGLDTGLTRINLPGGGSIVALTSAAASKDGGKDTFDVFDETHLWKTPELKRLHATVTRNLIKRQMADGWSLETSTMYGRGENSVAEETHTAAKNAPSLLFDHRQAPENVNLNDDDELLAALAYVYGPAAAWMDLRAMVEEEFRNPTKKEADNRRYWLNQPVKLEKAWIDPRKWAERARARELVAGEDITLGFDGSYNHDATALIGLTRDGHLFVLDIWERPEDAPEDWVVPRASVRAAVARARAVYRVRRMFCDPPGWHDEISGWEEDFGVDANDEDIVVRFDTNQTRRFSAACDLFEVSLKRELLSQDGDGRFARHIANCRIREARGGRVIDKDLETQKIDAGVAAVLAVQARSTVKDLPITAPATAASTAPTGHFWRPNTRLSI